MTRAQLERVRAFVVLAVRLTAGTTVQGGECLDILDAELAKPEALEWRAVWPGGYWQQYETMERAKYNSAAGGRIESRTPAGPWERAEVKQIEGEK